jgi:nucleoside-diphosphate-sugar epimerase
MKVLLVGGSGMVGTFVTPYLAREHELRVLDVRPPRHPDLVEYVEGSITDADALARAMDGMDTFIDMVMVGPPGPDPTPEEIATQYQVNALGVHLMLRAALAEGITHGVYVSTRTVHSLPMVEPGRPTYCRSEEEQPRDNESVYGMTKGMGELICERFAQHHDMRLIALRISGPRTREQFLEERRRPIHPGLHVMDEEDLANALLAALRVSAIGHGRFDAVLIVADEHGRDHDLAKARALLGWEPKGHLLL